MRVLFLPVALLIGAAPPAPARPVTGAAAMLSADAEQRWVPFDLTPGNQIRFTLALDGKPVTAILDTGVSHSAVSRAYVDAARLAVRPGGNASAIGGGIAIGWIDTRSIEIGGLTRTGGSVTVAVLPPTATGSMQPIDMLVGRDLTAGYALDIDYDGRRFRLLRSGRLPFRGGIAPLAIDPARLVYVSELTIGGRRLRPMIVDSGDGNSITLSSDAWRDTGIAPIARTTTISYGLGGAIVTDLVVLPEARIGDGEAARLVETLVEPAQGFSQSMGVAGRIGSGFLQRYRVLLDPGAGRLVLRPGARADLPPLRSTSGLLLGEQGDRLRVLHLMRGGPAEADGWKVGDAICSVDGAAVPADYAASPIAGWTIGVPGRTVSLGMCDGSVRALTLRRFY